MAESLSRRTTCNSRCQLRSWAWCLLLQCLPCVSANCVSDVDINVSVYPQGDIYVKYGEPLEMYCVTDGVNANSTHLQFTLGGSPLPSEIVNKTTLRLFISKPVKQSGSYYCQNTINNRICTSRVLVDSPPGDVTDFSCLSNNLESLNCSWTIPPLRSIVNYNVTFSIKNNIVLPYCQASEVGVTRYCNWATNSTPRYRQQEEKQFFYLKGCSVFGCNSQNFSIDHFSIVKPGPPEELKKLKYDAHSVLLKWKVPNNIIDFLGCGVDHIIQYQIAKVDNRTHFRSVDTTGLPAKNKTYRFNLTDLPYAYMKYDIRIYIKSKSATDKKYWSEKSVVFFTTASEIPNRPPAMISGAFHQSTFDTNRVIIVYWKQLEEWEEAGPNFTYKVLVSQNNKTQTVFPEKNKSMSFVSINTTLSALDVTVWSYNINGSSIKSSHIYIPSDEDTRSLKVTSFTKLAYENGTYELSWGGIKDIDNYTLFWCQHNATDICIGRLDFAVLDPHKTSHIIDLPREDRYQFAISANNGSKSSGMSWAKCDIWKESFVMYRFEAHLKYDGVPTKSSVSLRWELGCTLRDGIIKGYNISYCPIVQTSTECDKSVKPNHVVIKDPKQMNITIDKLYSFKTYQFSLALITFKGQKNIENATVRITTLEDAPTRPRNVQISNITYDSLVITWDPPLNRNGIISKYEIFNYNKSFYTDKVSGTDTSRRQILLTNLQAFTNYSLVVRAWNEAVRLYSELGYDDAIFVRTSIGPPSRLKAPTVKNNPDMLEWEPPENAGGTVDLYQIRIVKDNKDKAEIINTTNRSMSLTHCEGVERSETYQVRAVNFDEALHHGALGMNNVTLPVRLNDGRMEYAGPWSEVSTVHCKSGDGLAMIGIFMGIFAVIGVAYGTIKLYKKYRKMEDIKPVLPSGLGIPEKDISKYPFSGWSSTNKDEKPSSDEALLLPNSGATISTPDIKQTTENCAASDHTDSTVLSSDSSARAPVDRQASTSDDGSNSSFIEADTVKSEETNENKEDEAEHSSEVDTSSAEDSPYFSDKAFKKNLNSGYVQSVIKSATGYVQSPPRPVNTAATKVNTQPATTSYVMAGLQPSVFTTSAVALPTSNPSQATSGYVLAEEVDSRSNNKLPSSGPMPKLGPESLPIMPSLPPPTKHSIDNSYIQLQSLDSLPSLKSSVRSAGPLKQPASSGYVSPADVVMHKHLNNLMSGPQSEESAILDPAMSPDAYCRFSWSTDPTNDNLHSLLVDSPVLTNKN